MSRLILALDGEDQVVSALTAPKGARYSCLECGGALHVKRGKERAAHFAHDHEDLAGCAGESVTHLAAKRTLRLQLQTELSQNHHIQWVQQCPGAQGGCRMRSVLPQRREVSPPWEVREEVTHGRYRFDVAVLCAGQVVFGFEVYHRHLVPDEKAAELDVPWLELVAEDILEFKPRIPYRGSVSEHLCVECQALAQAIREQAKREAQRQQQTRKYAAEVSQVSRTWTDILAKARQIDQEQRMKKGGHR
ncbi:Competence protein [Deinococcus saxicola]|uniref:competence protein CoiA family protein n=1 Tax=Deinococcus saxicola TaxID=249406 RepID=UPI0039EE4A96